MPLDEYVLMFVSPLSEEYRSDEPKIFVGFRGKYGEPDEIGSAWGDGYVPFDLKDITHWAPLPEEPE